MRIYPHRRWIGLPLVLALSFLVAACAEGDAVDTTTTAFDGAATTVAAGDTTTTDGTGSTTGPESGEERVLHIYQINALTGQSAPFGIRAVNGTETAAAQINEGGGFEDSCGNSYTIELTQYDMANDGEAAIAGIREAAADPSVSAVIGATPSTGFLPILPVAGDVEIPLVSPGSGAIVEEWNPYGFRVTVANPIGEPAQMEVLEGEFGVDRVALIYDITQDAERSGAEIVRDAADEIGYEVVAFESFQAGDTDIRAQLTSIAASEPEWIGVYGAPPELTRIVNQMDELGLLEQVDLFGHAGIFTEPDVWDLTEGRVEGAYTWTVSVDLEAPESEEFVSAYSSQFPDDEPTIFSVYGYQALSAVVDAATRACTSTDRQALRDALGDTELSLLGGGVTWISSTASPNGENLGAAEAVQVVRVTGRETVEVVGS